MTEEVSLSTVSGANNVTGLEELDSLQSHLDEGKEAIKRGDFELAFEIILRLDKDVALCSRQELGKVVDLVKRVFERSPLEGVKLTEVSLQRISFSVDQNLVSYIADGLSGSFHYQIQTTEKAVALQEETYALFQKEGSTEQLEGKIKELFDMAEGRQVSYQELMRFFFALARLNIKKFETLIPAITPIFQVKLEGNKLTLSGFGIKQIEQWNGYLLRDFSAVIPFIDGIEEVDDQVEYCFDMMKLQPEKEAELLAKAKECLPNASETYEKFGCYVQFAEYYLEKKDEVGFHQALTALSEIVAGMLTDKVEGALRVAGLQVDWSLAQGDKASFERHLSAVKQLASQLSDPDMIEYAQELIEDFEAEGTVCFGSDALLMHTIKV